MSASSSRDFRPFCGVLHDFRRRLGCGPQEVLHQFSRFGGERHAQVFGRMKLFPLALSGKGEDTGFQLSCGGRGVVHEPMV